MRTQRLLAVLVPCVLAACASVDERIETDARALQDELLARGGLELELERREPVLAQELSGELDDATLVRAVLASHPRVEALLARLGVSSSTLVQAGRVRNPALSVGAMFFDMGTEVDLGLAQPLVDLLLRGRRVAMAEHEHEREAARIASQIVGIVHEARRALWEARGARALLALREEARGARAASLEMARALHQAGNVTDRELAVEDAAFGRAELAVLEARLRVAASREALVVASGLARDSGAWTVDAPLVASTEAWDASGVEERSVKTSLELRAALAATRALGERAGVARWNQLVQEGEVGLMARHEMEGDWGFGPMLTIGVPVFDQAGATDAASRERLRAAMADAASIEVEVRSRARVLSMRALVLAERAALESGAHAARLESVVTTTLQQFNAMQVGAFDVIRAKEMEIEGRARAVSTLVELARTRIDLEELLAGRLSRAKPSTERTDEPLETSDGPLSGHHR